MTNLESLASQILHAYLSAIGKRGGSKNSDKQKKHRKEVALRAMMHARCPNNPRWKDNP